MEVTFACKPAQVGNRPDSADFVRCKKSSANWDTTGRDANVVVTAARDPKADKSMLPVGNPFPITRWGSSRIASSGLRPEKGVPFRARPLSR